LKERVTDRVEHNRFQVSCYADAWQRLLGEPVKEMGLYFTCVNQ
jgi:hypothetical protein